MSRVYGVRAVCCGDFCSFLNLSLRSILTEVFSQQNRFLILGRQLGLILRLWLTASTVIEADATLLVSLIGGLESPVDSMLV